MYTGDDIKENQASIKLNILKGFVEVSDVIEKARQVGEVHSSGKYVWTQLANGKFDWRANKGAKEASKTEKPKHNLKLDGTDNTDDVVAEYQKKNITADDFDKHKKAQGKNSPKTKNGHTVGDSVTFKTYNGLIPVKAQGEIVSVDKDGKYVHIRTKNDLKYVEANDIYGKMNSDSKKKSLATNVREKVVTKLDKYFEVLHNNYNEQNEIESQDLIFKKDIKRIAELKKHYTNTENSLKEYLNKQEVTEDEWYESSIHNLWDGVEYSEIIN